MRSHESSPPQMPFNTLPPAVVAMCLLIMGIEVAFNLGARGILGGAQGVGWRLNALQQFAFAPQQLWWMIETWQFPFDLAKRPLTYAFVQGNFTQAIFVCVFLLAMGKMVAEAMGEVAMLLIFVASAIGGALVYGFVVSGETPLIGGFPAVYGLIGGFTHILWRKLGQVGAQQSRAFSMIAFLMGFQLLFGLLFGGNFDWIADLAGFATGFLLSFFVAPGALRRIRDRMRHE
ncbi:MAG: rhomboid family intramembrane serine protease [Epibacterium sp.]|nr:rhomboid family intramembrane serine protease [Epibacterium sp.]NQX72737.1 rhomboid family intramembrane serine protease [Epibacterium sp.]